MVWMDRRPVYNHLHHIFYYASKIAICDNLNYFALCRLWNFYRLNYRVHVHHRSLYTFRIFQASSLLLSLRFSHLFLNARVRHGRGTQQAHRYRRF